MNYYTDPITKKYADFIGRATRKEFWMFTLLNLVASILISIVTNVLDLKIINSFYSLAVLIPSIAIGIRRLHDTNHSGWWLLLAFVPIIGWIVLLYFYIIDTQLSDNQYGPNPKVVDPAPTV